MWQPSELRGWKLLTKHNGLLEFYNPENPRHRRILIFAKDPQESLSPNAPGTYTEWSEVVPSGTGTFGKTAIGGTREFGAGGVKIACRFYLSTRKTITKITAYIAAYVGTINAKCVIYNDFNGAPSSLVGSTAEVTGIDTTPAWRDFNYSTYPTLDPGYYWLTILGSASFYYYDDPGATNQMAYNVNPYDSFSDPFGTPDGYESVEISIYATYIYAHWEAVDDPVDSPDDDSTYIRSDEDSNTIQNDTFALPNTSIAQGSIINWVRVYNRVRSESATYRGYTGTLLYTYGTLYVGTWSIRSATYTTVYDQWNTNPNTGSAWTIDEINALEVGVRGQSYQRCTLGCIAYTWIPVRCTQVYALIDFTVPPARPLINKPLVNPLLVNIPTVRQCHMFLL